MDKKFIQEIFEKSCNYLDEDTDMLIKLCEELIPDIENHLKDIRQTLTNFDIHDEAHALQVLKNMLVLSNFYESDSKKLSNYEYFLIIMAAYLHDSGMALPTWQLNLFKSTEGNDLFKLYDEIELEINNDGKRPYTFSEARNFVIDNKEKLYINFENVKEFIFCENTEEQFIESLSKSLIDYQDFRNGFSEKLKQSKEKIDYQKISENIRYEYIRCNHHLFSEKNCGLLTARIESKCGPFIASKLSNDLSRIVVGHGLDFSEIENYSLHSKYSNGNYANQFFITVLLRLADVIHFSEDRAPESLRASKMIQDTLSITHWKVKQEGINYWLTSFDEKDNREIAFSAYFREPKLYYFFQEYLDWIDSEISNYYIFLSKQKKDSNQSKLIDFYDLKIVEKVNRSEVLYDANSFIPVNNLKFTLNQNRILELLMGVGLYKDKYLCLRELYQNSMDTCKCALAGGFIQEGNIEFGIEEDTNGRFLYCIDNGMGMDKKIIENYFLNIGVSYYQSRSFYEMKATWDNGVSTTSQFGIGILSCFMIGNEIEVITKNLFESVDSLISFKIDGPHEKFYYKKPESIDVEKVGKNGTLIKIYLSDQEINNDIIENIDIHLVLYNKYFNYSDIDTKYLLLREKLDNNIYSILFKSIGSVPENINVIAKLGQNYRKRIVNNFDPLAINSVSKDELNEILDQNYGEEYISVLQYIQKNWDDFTYKLIEVKSTNITLSMPFVFPTESNTESIKKMRSFPFSKRGGLVSIDGVIIEDYNIVERNIRTNNFPNFRSICPFFINFEGSHKPKLSVDRLTITDFSADLAEELRSQIEKLKLEFFNEIKKFIDDKDSKLINKEFALEKIIDGKKFFSLEIIGLLEKNGKKIPNKLFQNLLEYLPDIENINEFFNSGTFKIKTNFLFSNPSGEELAVYLSKILGSNKIEITEEYLMITCDEKLIIRQDILNDHGHRNKVPFLTYADNWDNHFADYDIVTGFFPIVSPKLFEIAQPKKVNNRDLKNKELINNKRINYLGSTTIKGLSEIGILQSVQVIPEMGFGLLKSVRTRYGGKQNRILNYSQIMNRFLLSELNNSRKTIKEENKDYVLRVYISISDLNQDEIEKLELTKKKNTTYYEGVYEGWSVIFLNKTFCMLHGKRNIKDLLKQLPSSFDNSERICYQLINGEKLSL